MGTSIERMVEVARRRLRSAAPDAVSQNATEPAVTEPAQVTPLRENGLEFVWQLCPNCEVKAIPRNAKLICPNCRAVVMTCCD